MQSFFIFKYAVELVKESIRKPSELLDTNSSVSTMCFLHLFAAAVYLDVQTLKKTVASTISKRFKENVISYQLP